MTLTIEQKQAIYEHLLTLDCPDLLAALIAERSDIDITELDTLSQCIRLFDYWVLLPEGSDFWREIYKAALSAEEEFESPTEKDFTDAAVLYFKGEVVTPKGATLAVDDVVGIGFTKLVIPQPVQDGESFSEWWTKVKLWLGKLFYKV
jgi:hypothetical protein